MPKPNVLPGSGGAKWSHEKRIGAITLNNIENCTHNASQPA